MKREYHLVGSCKTPEQAAELAAALKEAFPFTIQVGGAENRFLSLYDDFGSEAESEVLTLFKHRCTGFIIGYKQAKGWLNP